MKIPEYDSADATDLATLVRKGAVSAAELLDAAMERIEARNPGLNAVVYDMYERARDRSDKLPDGPLSGVPFLVKDLLLQISGTPTSGSSHLALNRISQQSSVLADRYEAAGLQIIGKTNTPEFGIMGVTESEARGPCRNPWNTDHSSGGSSGGAAAAVAARIVPAAHGGDGGGSIRIPASACGLFGLKPTRGRVTMAPFAGEVWGGLVQQHVICRSVRDSALLLDIADPLTPGEPYAAPHKIRPWVEEIRTSPGRLRIGFSRDALYADNTHAHCRAAVDDAVNLLVELGHDVVEARPRFSREEMVRAYYLTVCAGVADAVNSTARAAGVKPRARDFEPATWLLALIAKKTPGPELVAAQLTMQQNARVVAEFYAQHDLFLTSTLAQPPALVGEQELTTGERAFVSCLGALPVKGLLDVALEKLGDGKIAYTPNTQLFNQTGQPAMSVPLYWGTDGLPHGVQFAARFGDEATLFRLAAQLEEARPWAGRVPEGLGSQG